MAGEIKSFDSPDETRPSEGKGKAEVTGDEACVSLDFGEYAKRD